MQPDSKAIQVLPWLPLQLKIAPPTEPAATPAARMLFFQAGPPCPVLCFQNSVPWAAEGPQLTQALGPMVGAGLWLSAGTQGDFLESPHLL